MKRIGILGAGGMGGTHARHYAGLRTAESGVYDPSMEKARVVGNQHGALVFDTEEELFAWADAIDVCTPTPFHAEGALKAIAAGKGVLVEKPMAQSLQEAAEIVTAAATAGVPLMVGQVVRYFPEFKRANALVREGKIGRPAAARMRRGGGPPRSEWFLDHTRSGGILVDLAVHDFDWLRWTLGEVKHLYARSVGAKTQQGPDYALTTLTFESGAVAHVESTWMDPAGGRATLEVCGSEGMIQYDSRQTAILRTSTASATRAESPLAVADDPYRNQLAAFVSGLETGVVPVTGEDGFAALAIGIAARESAMTGRVVVPGKALAGSSSRTPKWGMLRRSLLAALACVGCAATAQDPNTMRVMTYNIEWFSEQANPFRIEHIQSILKTVNPTIVAVQEVQSKAALQQIFGSNWTIAVKDDPSEDQETGLAIKHPYELLEADTLFKDSTLDFAFPGGRNVMRVVVKAPNDERITFYVVHCKSRGGGRLQTDFQREAAAGMLASYIKAKKEPNAIVLGDFNDCPDDVSVNILESGNLKSPGGRQKLDDPLLVNLSEKLYDQDYITHGLSALYKGEDLKPIVAGAKAENEKFRGKDYNFPGDVHVEQILFDQLLLTPALAKRAGPLSIFTSRDALEGRIGTTKKDGNGKAVYEEKGTRASDHLPVFVDIRLGT